MVEINQQAPDFTLADQDGNERKLSDFRGKKIILAFYPFDFSPVCTVEFGCFEQDLGKLNGLNTQSYIYAVRIMGLVLIIFAVILLKDGLEYLKII